MARRNRGFAAVVHATCLKTGQLYDGAGKQVAHALSDLDTVVADYRTALRQVPHDWPELPQYPALLDGAKRGLGGK